jgi:hypothetical protein
LPMTRTTPFTLLALACAMLLAVACGNARPTSRPSPTPSNTPPIPTFNAPTNPPTPTSTPTSVPTVVPTLVEEDARLQLAHLLSTNGGCRLPCLWGIDRDQTTYQQAQAVIAPLTGISTLWAFKPDFSQIYAKYFEPGVRIATYDFNLWDPPPLTPFLDLDFYVSTSHDTINRIVLRTRVLTKVPGPYGYYFAHVFDNLRFGNLIRNYMLPRILADQGVPAYAGIAVTAERPSNTDAGFEILLLYPDRGLLAQYAIPLHMTGTTYFGCPSSAVPELHIEVLPPGEAAFSDALNPTDWATYLNSRYETLFDATGMTLDQFTTTFRTASQECIHTPLQLWPSQQ